MSEYIGHLAAILTTISFVPQVYKVYKTDSVKDISFWMFLLFSVGVLLWFVYGLIINNLPIILANAITFLMAMFILTKKIKKG